MKVGGRERVPVNNDELLLFSVLLGELGELRVHGRGDCLPLHLGGCFSVVWRSLKKGVVRWRERTVLLLWFAFVCFEGFEKEFRRRRPGGDQQ
jgi:hypothetical protein